MRELAAINAPARMLKPLSFRFDEPVFERPLTGSSGTVVPPILPNQVAHKHPRPLGRYGIAECDRILARLRAILYGVVDVAPATPDIQPFVSGITAGVLTAAAQAPHVGAD